MPAQRVLTCGVGERELSVFRISACGLSARVGERTRATRAREAAGTGDALAELVGAGGAGHSGGTALREPCRGGQVTSGACRWLSSFAARVPPFGRCLTLIIYSRSDFDNSPRTSS